LRKATISVVMSVRPFVRMEQLSSHCTDFHEISYSSIFRKTVKKTEVSLKSEKKTGTLREDQYTFLIISRSVLLRIRNVSDKSCRGNQNTHLIFSNFFSIVCRFWDNVEIYCSAGQATYDNMVMRIACWRTKATHTHTHTHTHTLRIYNSYCFSTTTVVSSTLRSVTFMRTLPVLLNNFMHL